MAIMQLRGSWVVGRDWEDGILDAISALSPTEFENLTYDCLRAGGMANLVWRTPGSDGGRDIEGIAYFNDISGHSTSQKWYIECKRYANSIDWPTVWKKVSYADVHEADYLLVSTNSNPSPACETQITAWNLARRRPIIRFWRGYDLTRIVGGFPQIAHSYGLRKGVHENMSGMLGITLILAKISQAAYVSEELGLTPRMGLETASCLSELLSVRLDDLERHTRFVRSSLLQAAPLFDWLLFENGFTEWEEVGLRAVLSLIRYQTGCDNMRVVFSGSEALAFTSKPRNPPSLSSLKELDDVSLWARLEVRPPLKDNEPFFLSQRP